MEALKETQLYCPFAYIDGSWVAADSGEQINVLNPATGESVGEMPRLGKAETERAIDAADAALPSWRALTAQERADLLLKWHDLMLEHKHDLALLMTHEQGKPVKEAEGEIAYAASFLRWFAEEARRVYGETIPAANANQRIVVTKQPVGVVGAITPWNFPAAMITRKAGAALAAGCTIVVNPPVKRLFPPLRWRYSPNVLAFPVGFSMWCQAVRLTSRKRLQNLPKSVRSPSRARRRWGAL